MKWLIALLVMLVLLLQYRLWVGEGSFAEVVSLKHADRASSRLSWIS